MLETTNHNHDVWHSDVRDYEVDFQGIVYNANYFNYLNQARALFLKKHGIDLIEYAEQGLWIVLVESKLNFKYPLRFGNQFFITSTLTKISQIRFQFDQKIFLNDKEDKILSVEAQNIICSINSTTRKPYADKGLLDIFSAL